MDCTLTLCLVVKNKKFWLLFWLFIATSRDYYCYLIKMQLQLLITTKILQSLKCQWAIILRMICWLLFIYLKRMKLFFNFTKFCLT